MLFVNRSTIGVSRKTAPEIVIHGPARDIMKIVQQHLFLQKLSAVVDQ
jgi:hypothetical protein